MHTKQQLAGGGRASIKTLFDWKLQGVMGNMASIFHMKEPLKEFATVGTFELFPFLILISLYYFVASKGGGSTFERTYFMLF